jgi:phage tail-like protein
MSGETRDANWPQPKFHFVVDIDGVGTNLRFQEVSGLDAESQPIEYRAGSSPSFGAIKMPGIRKFSNITLKRGVFAKDNRLFDWLTAIKSKTTTRSTVTITLVDETGHAAMKWSLVNAWPVKISGPDLKAEGNDVAIETLELGHEGLTIANK